MFHMQVQSYSIEEHQLFHNFVCHKQKAVQSMGWSVEWWMCGCCLFLRLRQPSKQTIHVINITVFDQNMIKYVSLKNSSIDIERESVDCMRTKATTNACYSHRQTDDEWDEWNVIRCVACRIVAVLLQMRIEMLRKTIQSICSLSITDIRHTNDGNTTYTPHHSIIHKPVPSFP